MANVPAVPVPWLVQLINEYAPQPRKAAGEDGDPYPDVMREPDAPRIGTVAEQDLADVARRLWLVFGAANETDRADRFNKLLKAAGLSPQVDQHGDLRWATRHAGRRALLLAACTASLLQAIQAHGWLRLGTCAGDDCLDIYLDRIGRGGRRYCSITCLNRARSRAYRSRQRTSSR